MFYTVEHTMKGKVDDILTWLENDMRVLENYEGERIRVVLRAHRDGNEIVVAGTMYEIDDASMPTNILYGPGKCEGFIFEVSRINDERSMIVGHIAHDNLFVKKLYFNYLARLADAFDAEWKQEAREIYEKIKKELEKEQGWHWGVTEGKIDKDAGRIERIFGRVPNEPNSTAGLAETLDARSTQASEIEKGERRKQKGRYRLTNDEIKRRKKIIKGANQIFKESNPKKTWKQIAYELDISERTLRDWRHNPLYS